MSDYDAEDLKRHVGHEVKCIEYGDPDDPENVTVECTDCEEVILDAEGAPDRE